MHSKHSPGIEIADKKKKKSQWKWKKKKWEFFFCKSKQEHFTIRQGAEDDCRTEAAVSSLGARPNLHFILSGPAEVC